jgi:hypothetical protein
LPEPSDLVLPLLRDTCADNVDVHEQTHALIPVLDTKPGTMEEAHKNYRAPLTGDTLIARLLTGEFKERTEALEGRVRTLETA